MTIIRLTLARQCLCVPHMYLNRSQGEIYICLAGKIGSGAAGQFCGASLKDGATSSLDFFLTVGQIGEETARSLAHKEYPGSSSSGRRCQLGVLRHKGFPPRRIRLEQSLPGPLQHKPQSVQVVQVRLRRTPAQRQPEAAPHKLAHRLPVTVGCSDARLRRKFLHRRFQLGSLLHVQRGEEPPVCSKTSSLGPPSANALAHWPMVWASRSVARPTHHVHIIEMNGASYRLKSSQQSAVSPHPDELTGVYVAVYYGSPGLTVGSATRPVVVAGQYPGDTLFLRPGCTNSRCP